MFIGRNDELQTIETFLNQPNGAILIYGLRRVGKTTLIKEALKKRKEINVYFECKKNTLEANLKSLIHILYVSNAIPIELPFLSFEQLFECLNTTPNKINIVLDEYPFLYYFNNSQIVDSLFQTIIDNYLSNIHLIVSGSNVLLMKKLLEERNALFSRFNYIIHLKELDYKTASMFYSDVNVMEKIAYYSIFSGSPFSNEFIDENLSLKDNIVNNILNEKSALYLYLDNLLLSDLSNSINIDEILTAISNGKKRYVEIGAKTNTSSNGLLAKQLDSLLKMGILSKVFPINKKNDNKKCFYQINDNLLRFFYTYVKPNKSELSISTPSKFYDDYILPTLNTFISYRFESICRQFFSLQIKSGFRENIIDIGTYYYDDKVNRTNGEFDVALKTKSQKFDIFEAKYRLDPISQSTLEKEIEQIMKIKDLQIGNIGFISANGFNKISLDNELISGDDLYNF